MNSNNLELSLIENEIEKITSRYHLKGNANAQNFQLPPQISQETHQEAIMTSMKSPSSIAFSGTTMQSQNNPLQELTLNKQGKVPQKDQKNLVNNMPKINPKDLSNEELEFIIKTGKLPPKFNNSQPPPQQQQQANNIHQQQYQQQHQITNYTQKNDSFTKTSSSHPQLQNYIIAPGNNFSNNEVKYQQQQYEKENQIEFLNDQNNIKNYNSPRSINDMLAQKMQPINSSQFQFSQPMLLPQQNSFHLDNSCSKTLDQSQLNQSTSQAATQALKALQDKVKQYEKENQLLQDKLQITESQSQDTSRRLQSKLKEETDRSNIRETQLKEEIALLKRHIETVENEKIRHLEENSNERDHWRLQNKKVEEENQQLRRQLQDQIDRYQGIEEIVQDIKRREAQLREKYEKELQVEKERSFNLLEDMEQNKQRYEELKSKIRQKNKELEQENAEMKEDVQKYMDEKKREIQKLVRDNEKWKRECQMVKEELCILGDRNGSKEPPKKNKSSNYGNNKIGKDKNSDLRENLKSNNDQKKKRKCYSPCQTDDKSKTLQLEQNRNFQSIESQKQQSSKSRRRQKSSLKKEEKQNKHKKNPSLIPKTLVASCNKENIISDSNHHTERRDTARISERRLSERKQSKGSSSKNSSKENRPLQQSKTRENRQSSNKNTRRQSSQKKQTSSQNCRLKSKSERSLNGMQPHQNLISINTKVGKAEALVSDENQIKGKELTNDYILVGRFNDDDKLPQRTLSSSRLNDSNGQSSQSSLNNKFNQYKRSSLEMNSSNQFILSTTSDFGNIYSHQSSMDNLGSKLNTYNRPMDLGDFQNEKNAVDNEIFYLEREIFDYNQQYKSMLTQQTNTSYIQASSDGANLNQKLRQIAQQLEEKSEKLFDLKKQQQQILMRDTYREKNPFSETGIKPYSFNQN